MLTVLVRMPPVAKKVLMVTVDSVLITLSLWLAFCLRLSGWYSDLAALMPVSLVLVLVSLPMFSFLGLYRGVVRHMGEQGVFQLIKATAASSLVVAILATLASSSFFPRSIFIIYGLLLFALLASSRVIAAYLLGGRRSLRQGKRVAIYGAAELGRQLASTLRLGTDFLPVVFLDRDVHLQGRNIDALEVLNPYRDDLQAILCRMGVDEILLAIPDLGPSQRRSILERLEGLAFHVRTVPSMEDILAGRARLDQLVEVSIEDLLGRDQVPAMPDLLGHCITGRRVLVTGAGGSIGSELCRQVLRQNASFLVLFEHSEFALYTIEMELRQICEREGLATELLTVLGSVQDSRLVDRVFDEMTLDTVYHAAAYKHVPMVEENPFEGIRNNVFGTRVVAEAAQRAGVRHFVLISTDKAVRPTNVMGASKRLAELVLQACAMGSTKTTFSMVRFGNVLGSSGSVVPLFRRQIAEGGPVTLTHVDITRFFMTIPEAVLLVIQAGAMASGGEVFVLDMGEPVRIVDLAEKMIRLSGHKVKSATSPDGDVEIQITGLRPGEKLYEELLIGDAVGDTVHPRILRAEEECFEWSVLQPALDQLGLLVEKSDRFAVRTFLQRWVVGYRPNPCESGSVEGETAQTLRPPAERPALAA